MDEKTLQIIHDGAIDGGATLSESQCAAVVDAIRNLAAVARMTIHPERDAYDSYHAWHEKLYDAAMVALGGIRSDRLDEKAAPAPPCVGNSLEKTMGDASDCPRCDGTGKYQRAPWDDPKPCAVCDGTGKIVAEEAYEDVEEPIGRHDDGSGQDMRPDET